MLEDLQDRRQLPRGLAEWRTLFERSGSTVKACRSCPTSSNAVVSPVIGTERRVGSILRIPLLVWRTAHQWLGHGFDRYPRLRQWAAAQAADAG